MKRPEITDDLKRIVKMAQRDLGMDDADYRSLLQDMFKVDSCTQLTAAQATVLIDDLKRKGFQLKVKGRPHNIRETRRDATFAQVSRSDQLRKIEALLTIGQKPWSYADALAKRICKVDRLAWVKDDALYKIITALRKQAQRKEWALND